MIRPSISRLEIKFPSSVPVALFCLVFFTISAKLNQAIGKHQIVHAFFDQCPLFIR